MSNLNEQLKVRQEIIDILENYDFTTSTELDDTFSMFKSDVWGLSQKFKKQEAYVYTKDEFIEDLNDMMKEAITKEEVEIFQDQIDEVNKLNADVVITTGTGEYYYI